MKHCKSCDICILDKCTQCPLCGGAIIPVEGNPQSYKSYPNPIEDPAKKAFILRIVLACSIFISVVSIGVNFLLEQKGSFMWWPIVILSIIYGWVATKPLWKPTRNSASIVLGETIILAVYVLALDYLLGYTAWSVMWGLPIAFLAGILGAAAVYICKPQKRAHYALFEILSSALGLIPIILFFCKVPQNRFLALGCAVASICCVLMVWVVGGQDTKNELSRRFKF